MRLGKHRNGAKHNTTTDWLKEWLDALFLLALVQSLAVPYRALLDTNSILNNINTDSSGQQQQQQPHSYLQSRNQKLFGNLADRAVMEWYGNGYSAVGSVDWGYDPQMDQQQQLQQRPNANLPVYQLKPRSPGLRYRDDSFLVGLAYNRLQNSDPVNWAFNNNNQAVVAQPLLTEQRPFNGAGVNNMGPNSVSSAAAAWGATGANSAAPNGAYHHHHRHQAIGGGTGNDTQAEPTIEDMDLIDVLWRQDIAAEKGAPVTAPMEQYETDMQLLTEKSLTSSLTTEEHWMYENLSKTYYEDFYLESAKQAHKWNSFSCLHPDGSRVPNSEGATAGSSGVAPFGLEAKLETPKPQDELSALLADVAKADAVPPQLCDLVVPRDESNNGTYPLFDLAVMDNTTNPLINNVSLASAVRPEPSNVTDSVFADFFDHLPTTAVDFGGIMMANATTTPPSPSNALRSSSVAVASGHHRGPNVVGSTPIASPTLLLNETEANFWFSDPQVHADVRQSFVQRDANPSRRVRRVSDQRVPDENRDNSNINNILTDVLMEPMVGPPRQSMRPVHKMPLYPDVDSYDSQMGASSSNSFDGQPNQQRENSGYYASTDQNSFAGADALLEAAREQQQRDGDHSYRTIGKLMPMVVKPEVVEEDDDSRSRQSSTRSSDTIDVDSDPTQEFKPRFVSPTGSLSSSRSRTTSSSTIRSGRPRGRQSKDEQLANQYSLPVSAATISQMTLAEMHSLMKSNNLNSDQKALIRKIRRRGKNKVAARACRQRRGASFAMLETETQLLSQERRVEGNRHRRMTNLVCDELAEIDRLEQELENYEG